MGLVYLPTMDGKFTQLHGPFSHGVRQPTPRNQAGETNHQGFPSQGRL